MEGKKRVYDKQNCSSLNEELFTGSFLVIRMKVPCYAANSPAYLKLWPAVLGVRYQYFPIQSVQETDKPFCCKYNYFLWGLIH